MSGTQEIINDLQRVSESVETRLRPSMYDFKGKFSVDEVIDGFGSWQDAMDKAGLSKSSEIIEDLIQTSKEVEGELTINKYREVGKFSSNKIQDTFGSWNEAKEEADLEIVHTRTTDIEDKELKKDIIEVQKKVYGLVNEEEYKDLGNYSRGTVNNRLGGWQEVGEKLNLHEVSSSYWEKIEYKKNRENSRFLEGVMEDLDAVEEDLEIVDRALELHGSLKYKRGFKVYGSKEALLTCLYVAMREDNIGIRYKEIMDFGNFESSGDIFSTIRKLKDSSDIDHKPVEAGEFIKRFKESLEMEEQAVEYAKGLCDAVDLSNSPSAIAAGSTYIACKEKGEKRTQSEIAEVFNVTEVTVRKAKQNILEDIEQEMKASFFEKQ